MSKKYIVDLSLEECAYLEEFTTTGRHAAYQITRARILLKANRSQVGGSWCDEEIKAALDVGVATVERVRRCFVEVGLKASLKRQPGGGRKRKLDGNQEAHLIALRCGDAPQDKPVGLCGYQQIRWWHWGRSNRLVMKLYAKC